MQIELLKGRAGRLFSEVVKCWLNYIVRFTPRTRTHYRMVITRFIQFAPLYIDQLTIEHIEIYINHIIKRWTNRTANAHLTAIKSFCRYVSEHYNIPNPSLNIKMLDEDPPEVRVLSDEEYQKVLAVCKPKERDVIRFLAHTGLRSSEFQQLIWNNISHDRRFIKLVGKKRRYRFVPLNKTCQTILNNGSRKPDSTTIDFVKSYKSRDSLYRLCKKLARHAGIPRFGPHALRHYFSTTLYKKGVPVQFISACLGHADTRTTEKIYVHLWPPRDLLGVTDCLDKKGGAG